MSIGNSGLDLPADAIAERVVARMLADQPERLLTVERQQVFGTQCARGSAPDRYR
jgi:hypothetical protein